MAAAAGGGAELNIKQVRKLCRALREDDRSLNNVATLLQVLERGSDEARARPRAARLAACQAAAAAVTHPLVPLPTACVRSAACAPRWRA